MGAVLDHYAHVMQTALLADDRPEQRAFYESLGLGNTQNLGLNAFYRANMQTDS
ncbi:hypothetical protein BOO71_0006007 [Deinococcus marmoris]|uniref:Acetyltransferase n=2 Tax=Deinococcus marmoris TaxID=249408 RepID=A0A1U7NZG3_9DEIO|nr:hypothetical protein BOO71_0006007 [Deinococcus marmoris]